MNLQFNSNAPPVSPPMPAPSAGAGRSASAAPPAAQTPTVEQVKQAVSKANQYLQSQSAAVQFSVDARTEQVVVRIVDSETKKLIRQIPSEEMMAISEALDNMSGSLIQQKA